VSLRQLKKEADEHPIHEACPKCRRTKEILVSNVARLKGELLKVRQESLEFQNLLEGTELEVARLKDELARAQAKEKGGGA